MTHRVLVVGPGDWPAAWRQVPPEDLDHAIREAAGRVFLAARHAGCLPVLRRLSERNVDVAGALLVAPPADSVLPVDALGIPTIVVAARDAGFDHARKLARGLGSRFVAGDFDAQSLLDKLLARSLARERAVLVSLALIS